MTDVDTNGVMMLMETMGERLKAARVAAGFSSAAKGAERIGVSASTYRAHENGQNEFAAEEAERYGRAFGVRAGWLMTGDEPPERGREAGPLPTRRPAQNASQPPVRQQFPEGTVPLLGQVSGGPNGRFVLNGEHIANVFCPPPLLGVKDPYAVYVYGDSMEPRFQAGEIVWLNPYTPVRQNDDVVVQIIEDGGEIGSYIKRFVSKTSAGLVLRQLNPPPGEEELLRFPEASVFTVHKIVFHQAL